MNRYRPEPSTLYKCPYCNLGARLRDADVVVDSYMNVCHYNCLMKVEVESQDKGIPLNTETDPARMKGEPQ